MALAAAFALLSFDEIASLHEWLMQRGDLYLAPLGAVGLALVIYSLAALHRAKVPLRNLTMGFALLATVPLQELIQGMQVWTNAWVYGARAFLEEGTEIAGVLLLLAAASDGFKRFSASRPERFVSLVTFGPPLLWIALVALPLVAVVAYALALTRAPSWLGSALFLLCALLALRGRQRDAAALPKAALYLLASVGANAVRADWDPLVLGHPVNVRAIYFAALLLAASWVLANGKPWRERVFWLALAVTTLLAPLMLEAQLAASTWPAAVAALCLLIEITGGMKARTTARRSATVESVDQAVCAEKSTELAKPPLAGGPR